MPITAAQYKASRKYQAKAYDRMNIVLYKGEKDTLRNYVFSQGYTLNGFIREAIIEKLSRMEAPKETLQKW